MAIQFYVFWINRTYWEELQAFDLNGDGSFSGAERTPEQNKAMSKVVNDTGGALAPITGGILCFVYFIVLYFLLKVSVWLKQIGEL